MFRTQSKETYESGLYTTTGMDTVVTAESDTYRHTGLFYYLMT